MNSRFKKIGLIFFSILISLPAFADGPPDPPVGEKDFFITIFLEGLFDASNNEMRKAMDHNGSSTYPRFEGLIADVITVELHIQGDYGTPVFTQEGVFLNQNGAAVAFLPDSGIYYLTIKHRNHIETVSATTINLETQDSYIFTDAANKAYGNNQKLLATGIYGIYAGDVNQDGVVNFSDRSTVQSNLLSTATGYISSDANGDGVVNFLDRSIVQSALLSIIQKIVPN